MVEEDREKHTSEPAGASVRASRPPDSVLIDGEASSPPEQTPEPAEVAAEAPKPVVEPTRHDSPPPPPRTDPPPARRPSRFGAFVAGAAGGAIVAALALAGGYSFLQPRADFGEAVASRMGALESGAQRETSALGALENRLAALETAEKTAPAPATAEVKDLAAKLGATDDKLSALAARLDKIDQAPAAYSSGPDASALAGRIGELEQALAAPKTETRAAPESGAGEKSAEVAVVAEALRDNLAAGVPFPAELAALTSLGVDPAKLVLLKPMADGGPSGPALSAAFAELAPSVLAAAAKRDGGSISERFLAHLRGLVVVHDLSEKGGDDPGALVTQVEALSRRGDLAGALAAFAKLPEPARKVAAAWAAEGGRAEAAAAALRSIREDAIGRLAGGKGQ